MLISKSNEVNARRSKIEFLAIKYIELLQKTNTAFRFMDPSYLDMFQEHFIYMYDKKFEQQNENTYQMVRNTLNHLNDKNINDEATKKLKEDIEFLIDEYPPKYFKEMQKPITLIERQNAKDDKQWIPIKIDRDMIGKKFQSNGRDFCTLYLPKIGKFNKYYLIVSQKLLKETKEGDLVFVMKNNTDYQITKYDRKANNFVRDIISSQVIDEQYSQYREYLKNNPDISYKRALNEFERTGHLDMEKIEDSYKFDGYQLEIMGRAFILGLPMVRFLDFNTDYLTMNKCLVDLLDEQREKRAAELSKKYNIIDYRIEENQYVFSLNNEYKFLDLDKPDYIDSFVQLLQAEEEEENYELE